MSKLPIIKAKKLIKILKKLGFFPIRQEGSHIFFKHPDGRTTVVPYHPSQDIGRGLLRAIIEDIKITPQQFERLI
jgi:predicted RNA binding protein YcfA (HicA-like mRNA interferase family)